MGMPLEAIDHVQITVANDDCEATLAFYEHVVGLRRIAKGNQNPGGWFVLGAMQLHVGVEASASRAANLASKRHVCIRVADLAAAERTCREADVEIIADSEPLAGCARFYVRDPGGNRVEVSWYDPNRAV